VVFTVASEPQRDPLRGERKILSVTGDTPTAVKVIFFATKAPGYKAAWRQKRKTLMNDQPAVCGNCGARCEDLAGFMHINARQAFMQCVNPGCRFIFFEEDDEEFLTAKRK
jgi:hypothetical protein